jgi:hypothetical protein
MDVPVKIIDFYLLKNQLVKVRRCWTCFFWNL